MNRERFVSHLLSLKDHMMQLKRKLTEMVHDSPDRRKLCRLASKMILVITLNQIDVRNPFNPLHNNPNPSLPRLFYLCYYLLEVHIYEALIKEEIRVTVILSKVASVTVGPFDSFIECLVCRRFLNAGDEAGVLWCSHRFHYDCVVSHVRRAGQNSCPRCGSRAI
ncbi:hypothetical protein QJS10_CPB18g00982 [Acorus calamus]|uniref:RING-type domain-containing protein n=1 Tax=Acorus calamus TaxID=4465 RepID=A0AAV9CMD0_ACOCL|nr:hypothetical protein QJS10_CPB18g00982 [Acorus calamus]